MPNSYLYSIDELDLKDKKVFIRTDFNVPITEGAPVSDHLRLERALCTIEYALKNKAKVIVASHRGRPPLEKIDQNKWSLEPLGYYIGNKLGCEVLFFEDILSAVPSVLLSSLNSKKIVLLENLRFYSGELSNDDEWAEQIASYVDIYINEAFSVSHRNHASVCALPQKVREKALGFSIKKETEVLDHIRQSPSQPFFLLVGGVKVKDKIKALRKLAGVLDGVLIGGAMAYTFLKAKGINVPAFLVQEENVKTAQEFIHRLEIKKKKLLLPIDHVVAPLDKNKDGSFQIMPSDTVPEGFCPVDIGPQTIQLFSKLLKTAKSIFWNGPLGKFENPLFSKGTFGICDVIAEHSSAFKVVGGGDSLSAVFQSGKADRFDYISTGGGASLSYLEKGNLPGIQSLYSVL